MSHKVISSHNINTYKDLHKAYTSARTINAYVPTGSVIDSKLFSLVELSVIFLVMVSVMGEISYMARGYHRKWTEFQVYIPSDNKSKSKNKLRDKIKWFYQSLMSPSPKTLFVNVMTLLVFMIGITLKVSYKITVLKPLIYKQLFVNPSGMSTSSTLGSHVVPDHVITGSYNKERMMSLTSLQDLKLDEAVNNFNKQHGSNMQSAYLTVAILYGVMFFIHATAGMCSRRKDVLRVMKVGTTLATANAIHAESKSLWEKLSFKVAGFMESLWRGRASYTMLDNQYDTDTEEEVEEGIDLETGDKNNSSSGAKPRQTFVDAAGRSQNNRFNETYLMDKTTGEHYTRLSSTYASVFFYCGETAFYGLNSILFLNMLDAVCVLIIGSKFTDKGVGLSTIVYSETVLVGVLFLLSVIVVIYTAIDHWWMRSRSLTIPFVLFLSIGLGTLIEFQPEHVNGKYVYVASSFLVTITFICLVVHHISSSKEMVDRVLNDPYYQMKKHKQIQPFAAHTFGRVVKKNT